MPKKTSKKTSKTPPKRRKNKSTVKEDIIRTFTLRIPESDLEFLDESAHLMNTSRQKLLATVIRGMRLAEEESNKQGTFFHMYTNHLSAIIEDSLSEKRHGR